MLFTLISGLYSVMKGNRLEQPSTTLSLTLNRALNPSPIGQCMLEKLTHQSYEKFRSNFSHVSWYYSDICLFDSYSLYVRERVLGGPANRRYPRQLPQIHQFIVIIIIIMQSYYNLVDCKEYRKTVPYCEE